MRYACIARHRDEFAVRLMCRVLDVSPAGFYASRTRSPSVRAIADERLLLNVRVEHAVSDETYGAPGSNGSWRTRASMLAPSVSRG